MHDFRHKSISNQGMMLKHVTSMKTIRNQPPALFFQLDDPDKNKPTKGKTRSPKGFSYWTGDSSPVSNSAMSAVKLPPMNFEPKIHSEPKHEVPVLKARGSILFEEPILRPKLPETNHRGSLQLDDAVKSVAETHSKKSSIKLPQEPQLRKNESLKEERHVSNCVVRCGYKTQAGSVMGKKKKHNQDSWVVCQKVQGIRGQYLFAVSDGHGDKGHKVSGRIREDIQGQIENALASGGKDIEKLVVLGIKSLTENIESSKLSLNYSGATLVSVFIKGHSLVCANIGDSRAVIGSKDSLDHWTAMELSSDHKPSREDEARRVVAAGGVVRQFQSASGESYGPLRVWSTSKNVPGLAMTRSIGDLVAKGNGIISEPEVFTRNLEPQDKFVILATDGIWEFISSQEAVDLIKDIWLNGKSEACCEKLLEVARARWEKENTVDDITVLVVFLNVR